MLRVGEFATRKLNRNVHASLRVKEITVKFSGSKEQALDADDGAASQIGDRSRTGTMPLHATTVGDF